MKAAALAAKGEGPLPPQLWRLQLCGEPTWSEFDSVGYRELTQALILKRVYETVQAWRTGKPNEDAKKYYGELVGMGIVG